MEAHSKTIVWNTIKRISYKPDKPPLFFMGYYKDSEGVTIRVL